MCLWEGSFWDTSAPTISDPETHPVSEHEMDLVSGCETASISESETHPVWEGLFIK